MIRPGHPGLSQGAEKMHSFFLKKGWYNSPYQHKPSSLIYPQKSQPNLATCFFYGDVPSCNVNPQCAVYLEGAHPTQLFFNCQMTSLSVVIFLNQEETNTWFLLTITKGRN